MPIPALRLQSLPLNWVSHLSQAMGKLNYTLFYMGFVLKKKSDANSKVWKVQPASVGTGVWLALSMLTKAHCGTRSSNHACPAAECHHLLLPVSGRSHQGKGDEASPAPAPSRRWHTRHRTLRVAQVQDLPLPLPSRLPSTFAQVRWKATLRNRASGSAAAEWTRLPWGHSS